MILDISDLSFKRILGQKEFFLPIRWDGRDFAATLEALLDEYRVALFNALTDPREGAPATDDYINRVDIVCCYLNCAVKYYLHGFPSEAYFSIDRAMKILMEQPLRVYHKTVHELLESGFTQDALELFRVTCVADNIPHPRKRVFHTPYSMRAKVATNRYSIAGYPSLYLGTSLQLCCEEVNYNRHQALGLCSKFKINRSFCDPDNDVSIDVIELAVKPQDFLRNLDDEVQSDPSLGRKFDELQLKGQGVRASYLLWYPLIAACSYIRVNKRDPFAAEYIIPQLLMQWVRREMVPFRDEGFSELGDRLTGIRYFSCASQRASDMGFNYVFPTSGAQISPSQPYCPVLLRAFQLTSPLYLHEYESIAACERALHKANDFDHALK